MRGTASASSPKAPATVSGMVAGFTATSAAANRPVPWSMVSTPRRYVSRHWCSRAQSPGELVRVWV